MEDFNYSSLPLDFFKGFTIDFDPKTGMSSRRRYREKVFKPDAGHVPR